MNILHYNIHTEYGRNKTMDTPIMTPTELQELLLKKQVQLIDVRKFSEYQSMHINDATLFPLSQWSLEKVLLSPDKKIVVYCHSGQRSAYVCGLLLTQYPSLPIFNLQGGIKNWIQEGLPTKSNTT